jgi:hypothetical protein
VGPTLIVVEPPRLDLRLRVGERGELVHVQTLIPQAAIEGFDERFSTVPRVNEIELDAALVRPVLEGP